MFLFNSIFVRLFNIIAISVFWIIYLIKFEIISFFSNIILINNNFKNFILKIKNYLSLGFLQINDWFFFNLNWENIPTFYEFKTWFLYDSNFENKIYGYCWLLFFICYLFSQITIYLSNKYYHYINDGILNYNNFLFFKKRNQLLNKTKFLFFDLALYISVFISLIFFLIITCKILTFMLLSTNVWIPQVTGSTLLIKFMTSFIVLSWWLMYMWTYKNKSIFVVKHSYNIESILLYLLSIFLFYMLLDTNNLLEFILLVETSSLIMCILCAISTTTIAAANSSIKHIEASLKLYIIGAFSSVFLLFGTSLIYGSTGCYNFEDISIITDTYLNTYFYPNYYDLSFIPKYFTAADLALEEDKGLFNDVVYNLASTVNILDAAYSEPFSVYYDFNISKDTAIYINYNSQTVKGGSFIMSIGLLLGVIFIFIGFGFKLGIAPMHSWLPDVYEGSNILFLSFMSIIPKLIVWFVFSKIYILYFKLSWLLSYLFFFLGILTSSIGIINGFSVKKIKHFISLSTIITTGNILFILSYGASINYACILFCSFYLFIYGLGILSILIFIIMHPAILDFEMPITAKKIYTQFCTTGSDNNIAAWSGFSKTEKIYSMILIFSILVCISLPPFSSFIIKWYILYILTAPTFNYYNLFDNFSIFDYDLAYSICFLLITLWSLFLYMRILKFFIFNYINNYSIFSINNSLVVWLQIVHVLIMFFLILNSILVLSFLSYVLI